MTAPERAMDRLSRVLMLVAGIGIILMMIHVAADIVAKFVFNAPVVATLEIVAWYYMVATVFLPIAWIQIRKKHLMVELFTRQMAPRRLAMLEAAIAVLSAIYVGILFYLTVETAIEKTISWEVQDVTYFDLPVWPSRWFLPLPVGAMTVILILQAVRDIRFALTGAGEPSLQPTADLDIGEA